MKKRDCIRIREMPYVGSIKVNKGQRVNPTDTIGELNYYPGVVSKINLSKELAIQPSKVKDITVPEIGDFVSEKDVLAIDARWGKLQLVISPSSGIISMLSRHLGSVYIRSMISFHEKAYETIDVGRILKCEDSDIDKHIIVKVGDKVLPGQIIAKCFMNGSELLPQTVTNTLYGIVENIDKGKVRIKNNQKGKEIKAFYKGIVDDVEDNFKVAIRTKFIQIDGVYGISGEASGCLRCIDEAILKEKHLSSNDSSKIILVRGTISESALRKAIELNVKGIIAASCSLGILKKIAGSSFLPSITGEESCPITVILLEGFEPKYLNNKTWAILKNYEDTIVSIIGKTHIRAGVVRPKVCLFCRENE